MKQEEPILPILTEVHACHGCGVCCMHMGYPPYIRPSQDHAGEKWWVRLPENLRTELDAFIANYDRPTCDGTVESLDGPCCWFDLESRQCQHHEHRPNVCRDFEAGSRQCKQWRSHYADRILPE